MKFLRELRKLLTAIGIVFLASSCKKPMTKLHEKINIAIRSGNNIEENEWNELTKYIIENKESFPNFLEDEKVNTNKLIDHILNYSLQNPRRGQTEPEIFNPISVGVNFVKPQVKFFIENSGSMDGYIRNTTEFEAALSDLLVQLQYRYDNKNLKISFINTKIYPSELKEIQNFVEDLEPEKEPFKVGDKTVSKLNEILKLILNNTSQNDISILVSDCIYSLDSKNDTEGALEFQKSLTKGTFLEKFKVFDFATIIVKMKSKFTGNYWNKDNNSTFLNRVSRPYYIWIIGTNENINDFSKKINIKSLKGFQYNYFLSNVTEEKQPYYTVLKETNKIGTFKQMNRARGEKVVKSISDIEYDGDTFQFSIAIDLSKIPVDSSYLLTTKNYVVPNGFKIKSVEKIDRNKISERDFKTVEETTATHVITVSTTNKFTIQDLKLELSNKVPSWVEKSNSTNDTDVKSQLDKTFGLSYLVQGVSEAYATQNPDQTSYFKITVTLKK
jgi:hypothetical protein